MGEQIFAGIMLVIIVMFLIFYFVGFYGERRKYKKILHKKKYDVITNNSAITDKYQIIGLIILFIIFIIITIYVFTFSSMYSETVDSINRGLGMIVLVAFLTVPIISFVIRNTREVIKYKNVFNSKYNSKFEIDTSIYLVEGDGKNLGSIRNRHKFIFTIPEYNCEVFRYDLQKLERGSKGRRVWRKSRCFIEYRYSNLNGVFDLNNEIFVSNLKKLQETRFISVESIGNTLRVFKMVTDIFTKEQLVENVSDVELFYNSFINGYQNDGF